MKLGLSSPLEHKTPEEWAENMQKIGCQAVNFPVDYTAPKEVIQAYEQAAKDQGLVIAEVGACCCVNVSGSKGARWDGPYKENLTKETWKDMVKSIQNIIDEADPQNTFYTIEPMPWMYPMGPDEYVKLIEDVDRNILQYIRMCLTGLFPLKGISIMKNLWKNALKSWENISRAAI